MTSAGAAWIEVLLRRNAAADYLRRHGAPRTLGAFRADVPIVDYETIRPWIDRIAAGEPDVLFAGRPIAFERTGGSSGGAKLFPCSATGVQDFQSSIVPWLASVVDRHSITGRVYVATSPATRPPQTIAGCSVGLPDGAYLGEKWGAWIAQRSAVPLDVAAETDVARWRARTLAALRHAGDLELLSVWSPTFLLRLLDDLPDPCSMWPRLRVVSCWADASSRPFADELRRRLPHAVLQPKGLLSTECVTTVPDATDRPRLTPHGFFEFALGDRLLLAEELRPDNTYEVIATTASGLYRYRSGDLVTCVDVDDHGPVLRFAGRAGIASDLVGEKLTDAFACTALADIAGFRFLTPTADRRGYELVTESGTPVDLSTLEERLKQNPQYAYARALGQLHPLRHRCETALHDRYVAAQVARGTRLADVKPLSLLPQADWLQAHWEVR